MSTSRREVQEVEGWVKGPGCKEPTFRNGPLHKSGRTTNTPLTPLVEGAELLGATVMQPLSLCTPLPSVPTCGGGHPRILGGRG